ncbi:MAG: hypothetical protein QXJ75_02380 [Candidatus Bathyarchaeia archaeon]
MGDVKFSKRSCLARLLSPLSNFSLETQLVEYRSDPLTGRRCRINLKRTERVKQTVEVEKHDRELTEVIMKTREGCFFCPENLESKTPKFPPDLIQEGKLRVGSACLFPNLYPFGEHHAVGVFSGVHYLRLDQFQPKLISDCFKVCLEYLMRIHVKQPDVRYGLISWNQMHPAGASIIHPHLQVLADRWPTSQVEELLVKSEAYYEKYKSNYWSDLVSVEKENATRLVGETGAVTWLASYAPQGNTEVLGVFSGVSNLSGLKDSHLADLCLGLSKILKGYHDKGVRSFNMTVYSGPIGEDLEYYSLNLKLMSRPSPSPFYTCDTGFMERLHYEPVIERRPEETAEELKKYF